MEVSSLQKFVHNSPRKLRLVADMIRKMEPGKALETLKFANKKAALDLAKAIKTALANAKVRGTENMLFKTIEINEGPKMKRFRAGARGRVKPYVKKMSHIKIILTEKQKEVARGAKD